MSRQQLAMKSAKIIAQACNKAMAFHERAESQLAPHLAKFPISCKEGCAACCHLSTYVGRLDGLVVASYLWRWDRWRDALPGLAQHAAVVSKIWDEAAYFAMRLPCPLLETLTKRCSVYPVRPSSCRYHYVVTPPEDCAVAGGKHASINLRPIQVAWSTEAWAFDPARRIGHLSVMVLESLLAVVMAADGSQRDYMEARAVCRAHGVDDIERMAEQWLERLDQEQQAKERQGKEGIQ